MERVSIDLGERSYDVLIGPDVIDSGELGRHVAGGQAAVVTNDTVGPLYVNRVLAQLDGIEVDVITLRDGESHKTLTTYSTILDELMAGRHNRTTTIIALGGGVVGDMAGFAAATFQRGVRYVQVPTTLLAQVDSSVGGKTAVNHPGGKNMIGAFYQPAAVLADTGVLASLPDRELRAGLAEVVKYGVIADAAFFCWLEANADALIARDEAALQHAIRRSVEIKARVVAADETESGLRMILNYGHTFGHALETLTAYREYLHGEAVAVGMVLAARLSVRENRMPHEHAERLERLVERLGLPVAIPASLTGDAVLSAMGMDKKVLDGTLRLILASEIGSVQVVGDPDRGNIESVVAEAGPGR